MANGPTLPWAGRQLQVSFLPWIIVPLALPLTDPSPNCSHFIHQITEASLVDLDSGSFVTLIGQPILSEPQRPPP